MKMKPIIGAVFLLAIAGFAVYEGTKEKGPLLSSTATPFPTEPVKAASGDIFDPWKVTPDSAQTAKLIETAQKGVQVERFFVTEWQMRDETDSSGAVVHLATLNANFSRRDESGRWDYKGDFIWSDTGWVQP
jgi:hypothetical protein